MNIVFCNLLSSFPWLYHSILIAWCMSFSFSLIWDHEHAFSPIVSDPDKAFIYEEVIIKNYWCLIAIFCKKSHVFCLNKKQIDVCDCQKSCNALHNFNCQRSSSRQGIFILVTKKMFNHIYWLLKSDDCLAGYLSNGIRLGK